MLTRLEEVLRPFCAVLLTAVLASAAHASLIPADADVLFSTSTPTISFGGGLKIVRPGDVLGMDGQVAITNRNLLKQFQPDGSKRADYGLDSLSAFRWASGKGRPVIYFSTDTSFYSQKLGQTVSDGDLLSKHGEIVMTNQQLLAAFEPNSTANFGLESFDVLNPMTSNEEIWFSTGKSFFSQKLGRTIDAGDVLSTSGELIATNADLLSAFDPRREGNYGLDALYVADNDADSLEIWFSTSKPFYSEALGRRIGAGDLLSSKGEIVATEAELMAKLGFRLPFSAGLDAFSITRTIQGEGRVTPPPVPEPATLGLVALGGVLVLARRRNND